MSARRWTDPATIAGAHAFLRDAAASAGRRITGTIEQPHVRAWSTVFRAPTDAGDVYLKLCGPSQAHEPALTALLAATAPALLPQILAIHPRETWMLLAGGGAKLRDALEPTERLEVWARILPPYAELQRSLLGRVEEIRGTGTPDHGPERLVSETLAPGRRPRSPGVLAVCTRNSSMASTGKRESRLPKALIAGSAPPAACAGSPPATTPVFALAPSTMK